MTDVPLKAPAAALFVTTEDVVLSVALAAMAIVPLAEVALRATLHRGIPGAASLVQHLTLVVGMVGAAIAARENRLLAVAGLHAFLKGSQAAAARVLGAGITAAVAGGLCWAALQFVASEREVGKQLIHGLPVWAVQAFLPLGFALVAARVLWNASPRWSARLLALSLAGLSIVVLLYLPVARETLVWSGLLTLLV